MAGDWGNGLFSCFNDCTTCILAFIASWYVFSRNAQKIGGIDPIGEGCVIYAVSQFIPYVDWYCRASVRGKIRESKGIEGSFIKDCLTVGFCLQCALVQEAQELAAPSSQSICRE